MTVKYRTAQTRREGSPYKWLDLNHRRDICGRHRSHGNHMKCSAARKLANAKKESVE